LRQSFVAGLPCLAGASDRLDRVKRDVSIMRGGEPSENARLVSIEIEKLARFRAVRETRDMGSARQCEAAFCKFH
jgi:hypothetical protein